MQPEILNFHSDEPHVHEIPPEIRMWYRINKFLSGDYKGYFANPFRKRFEICNLKIEETGLVNIYDSVITGKYKKEHKGISRIGTHNHSLGISTKLMILADYSPEFLEYRIKIYLDMCDLFDETSNMMKGIYTCFRSLEGQPFASKFVLKKIVKTKDDSVSYMSIKNPNELDELKSFLTAEGVYDYFFNAEDNLLSNFTISFP